jgi:3-hydroxy-9,10-secoandrosta-1,3,5(10)-triene-9,17-dione monooxygenase
MDMIERAESLAPLFRATAREAEIARRPLDHVIEAVRESGLFSLMVPKEYGGHELDLDTFFEVALILSKADASMGWLTGFYIEHNLWLLNYPESVCKEVMGSNNHVLAPATLNIGGGRAKKVDGGYRLSGQWQWGTGIIHSTWVMAGGLAIDQSGNPVPMFFLLPLSEVEPIDTWYVTGMCATGSWDFKIDDVFVADEYAMPFQELLSATSGIAERFSGPLYSTPLMPVLGFAGGVPILGAAQMALEEFSNQTREKIEKNILRAGTPQPDVSGVIGEAALKIETAELVMRDVLADVMAKRNMAAAGEQGHWLSRLSYAVFTCKEAVLLISAETGASGGLLSNPIQRALRDISIATNHVVFSKTNRYGDVGRSLTGQ